MLRIVHPPRGGKEPVHPKKGERSPALMLTDAESTRLRGALRHLRGLFGTWACLADAMGVKVGTLEAFVHRANRGSAAMALAAARASGTPMERLLSAPSDASACPHCGAKRVSP